MKTIWKYAVAVKSSSEVLMPEGARILPYVAADPSGEPLIVWAEVDTDAPKVPHKFFVVGTGHPLTGNVQAASYVGTVEADPFVWHVYHKELTAAANGEDEELINLMQRSIDAIRAQRASDAA